MTHLDHLEMESSVHLYRDPCASLLTQVTLIQIKGSLKKRERKEYVFRSASFWLKRKFNINFGCGVSRIIKSQRSDQSSTLKFTLVVIL